MATKPHTTTRRALLGAAAALPLTALPMRGQLLVTVPIPTDCTTWTRRLTRYHHLAERAKHVAETGWFRAANDRYNRETEALNIDPPRHPGLDPGSTLPSSRADQEKDGCRIKSGITEKQKAETARQAAFARVTRAENLYYDRHTAPLMRAATLVATTPAPDLPALLAKIWVMQAHEMQEDGVLPEPALGLLAEDVGRLSLK